MIRGSSCGVARPCRALSMDAGEAVASAGSSLSAGKIRHAIRLELPPHVFCPQPLRALIAGALFAAIVATDAAILELAPLRPVEIALSLLSGALSASLFFLGHECCHGAILRRRWAQDVLAFPAFLIFLLSPTFWRSWHNNVHHVRTNSPEDDPDNFGSLASYRQSRVVRLFATLTPGSGRRSALLYFAVWFAVHAQVVQWYQSRRCRGFTGLNRRRAAAETVLMTVFWLALGLAIGAYASVLVIILPMMVANAIIMSYIATNHLLLPLNTRSNPLDNSMSVTTHPVLDRVHFNFSYHVEHHLFPTMSPKFAPLVRAKLRQFAPGRLLAPDHLAALRMVFRTPRMHDANGDLIDPTTGRRVGFVEIMEALCRLGKSSRGRGRAAEKDA